MRFHISASALLAISAALLAVPRQVSAATAAGWEQLPALLKRIVPPEFPKRDFIVTDFGAAPGGQTNCSPAFNSAIQACARSGGGRVVVPEGIFRSGPIHLRSNVELHLAKGAEIIFSDRIEDYLPNVFVRVGGIELYNYSPLIYARGCTNIAVTGPGRLNGNARVWWDWKTNETKAFFEMGARGVPVEQRVFGTREAAIRPSFLSFVSCTNILLEGFTIGSGPNWTIHPIYCVNTTIRRVNVDTDGPNNDGIDPDSCIDMLIEDCTFSTGDDCVVLKSGYNEDGWRVNRPMENLVMRRCFSKRGHGGLVIGSEMSGSVRNVFMYDCEFDGTDRAIRIKSRRGRGGVVENVFARNLKVRNIQREVVIMNMDYSSDRKQAANEKPPVFRNISISDVTAAGAPTAILLSGLEDSLIENVRFENMTISSRNGVVASCVTNIVFETVQVKPAAGAVFKLKDASEVLIRKSTAPEGTKVFLQLDGTASRRVTLEACDLDNAETRFITNPETKREEVIIK